MEKLDRPTARLNWSVIAAATLWFAAIALVAFEAFLVFGIDWRGVPADFRPNASSVAGFVPTLAMSSVGALIAVRHPANRIGWLLLVLSLTASFLDFPRLYVGVALYVHPGLPGALWLYWINQVVWILVFGELLVLLPLLFPDGKLLSRRWSIVIGLATIPVILVVVASLDPMATAPLHNPVGVRGLTGMVNVLNAPPFSIFMLGTYALAVSSLVVRYRRGREQERQQLKWLVVGIVVLLAAVVSQFLIPALQNTPEIALAAALLPIAIGIGVLRYRLYDIDLIINKALVYGGLAAIITAVYALVVINIG